MRYLLILCLFAAPLTAQTPPVHNQPAGGIAVPSIDPALHDRVGIRFEPGQGNASSGSWISTLATTWVPIPKASATFVAHENSTNVAMTFSGEAYSSIAGKRMFVRALVDGVVAAPADVVFTEGPYQGSRSFTFGATVAKGVHSVEMQWLVDVPARAFLRAESLLVRAGKNGAGDGTIVWRNPPSGPSDVTQSAAWTDVPSTSLGFQVTGDASTMIVFSSEAFVAVDGQPMFVRALVDNVPTSPGDVLFTQDAARHSRSMSFGVNGLAVGNHTAKMQWQVGNGGAGFVGDRTLVVSSYPSVSGTTHELVAAPSGPSISKATNVWSAIPGLSKSIYIPENGEIAATYSGEVMAPTGTKLEMRLKVGSTASTTDVVEIAGTTTQPFQVQSFAFDMKNRNSYGAGQVKTAVLEWRAIGGTVWMGDRTLGLFVEAGAIPDLAEAPGIGGGKGNSPEGSGVEAAIGVRKLLTILHDPHRPDADAPPVADVTAALFGAHSVADYFKTASGGRFKLENAGILGWVDADKDWTHYWIDHPGCNDMGSDGFTGGHQERWTEALDFADLTVDFSTYDLDHDGTVTPRELGILIVTPQATEWGDVRELAPNCSNIPYVTNDGVVIREIAEWFTRVPDYYLSGAAHELAHHLLGLSDMYVGSADNPVDSPTEPGKMSLMAYNHATTTHIDPANRLALGWLTPRTIWSSGNVSLEDVKSSREVIVLPRRIGGDGKEFFVIENREHEATDSNHPLYDESGYGNNPGDLRGHGLAIWHVVEDTVKNDQPPVCLAQPTWITFGTSNARQGIRLMNPRIDHTDNQDYLWSSASYDLFDDGEVCPSGGDDPLERRNVLKWADGTPSGYAITHVSAPGAMMTFNVTTP